MSLRGRLERLERGFRQVRGARALDLLIAALDRSQIAADELRALGDAHKRGHVHEFLDALAPGIEDEPEQAAEAPAPAPQAVPVAPAAEQADQSRIIAIDTAKGEVVQ